MSWLPLLLTAWIAFDVLIVVIAVRNARRRASRRPTETPPAPVPATARDRSGRWDESRSTEESVRR